MRRSFLLFAILIAAAFAQPALAQQMDVIRGRVTGPDSLAVQGVTVRAMSYMGNVTKVAKTDKNGRFTITFPNGEGDYWLEFTSIGFVPKRFEIKRVADEEILIADTRMASNIATLETVNITANAARALVNRNDKGADAGGGEKNVNSAVLPPDQMGNLAAMASTVPGIQLIPGMDGAADMFSALGLGSDQNSTTFNGLGSSISVLPPDAQTTAAVIPYSYDPAAGGFSGALIRLSSAAGSNISNRQASSGVIAPDLEFTDDVGDAQNQKYTNLQVGSGGRGPITLDRNFYNTSFSLGRNFKDLPSLLNTSALGLASAGVARDSVTRLLDILRNAGIPTTLPGAPRLQANNDGRFQANLDFMPGSSGVGNAFTLGYLGNVRQSQQVTGGGNAILTVPAHNGETNSWSHILSLRHTNYIWFGILSNTSAGVSFSGSDQEPYLHVPNGSVRINSALPDGGSAVKSLSFGGQPFLSNSSRNRTVEIANELRWYAGNNKHSVKLTTNVRHEQYSVDQGANLFGSFSFNSLSDLELGRPASYSRVLFAPKQEGSQIIGSMSLGDFWRPTTSVQIQYGFRVDGNHFLSAPALNQNIAAKFGVSNTYVPNRVYVSPRLGFTWMYGTAPQIAFMPGAARPPRALIQGGVGMFQNLTSASLISGALNNTGLPGSTQTISCVGPAAPVPDWGLYRANPDSIPTTCADGTAGTIFSNGTPSVSLFDRAFQQQRSWRSNLNWGGPILDSRFAFGVSAVYSLNLNQQGTIDLNLNRDARFTLANEGGRPVYANPSAIDPRTGVIASRDTRVTPDFLRATETRSDLRSESRLLLLTLKPVTTNPKLRWTAYYQLLALRDKYRGFTSTVGDPFSLQWGQSLQSGRHTLGISFADFPIFDVVYITFGVSATSGPRYTPSIAGDVNGDGSGGNDRAFIFNPAAITDTALSAGMQSLLARGSSSARECLRAQLGQLASRGSCTAPWNMSASLNFRFNPQKIGLPKRTSINFSVTNPLGLADLLFNGQNNIKGWGTPIPPDQSLLFVRGFDPTTKQYKYEVNQRFGSTRPTQTTARVLPLISLRVVLDIGSPRERQLLTQRLDQGRARPGTKLTAPSLKSMGSSTIPNPMALILQQPDSLKLTRKQADSLASMSRSFTLHADSLWSPVSKKLETLDEGYDRDAAYAQYVRAREKTIDYLIVMVPKVKSLLTASQKRRLPLQLMNYLDVRVLKFLRTSSSGDGRMFFF